MKFLLTVAAVIAVAVAGPTYRAHIAPGGAGPAPVFPEAPASPGGAGPAPVWPEAPASPGGAGPAPVWPDAPASPGGAGPAPVWPEAPASPGGAGPAPVWPDAPASPGGAGPAPVWPEAPAFPGGAGPAPVWPEAPVFPGGAGPVPIIVPPATPIAIGPATLEPIPVEIPILGGSTVQIIVNIIQAPATPIQPALPEFVEAFPIIPADSVQIVDSPPAVAEPIQIGTPVLPSPVVVLPEELN